jgi:hypothetical protein
MSHCFFFLSFCSWLVAFTGTFMWVRALLIILHSCIITPNVHITGQHRIGVRWLMCLWLADMHLIVEKKNKKKQQQQQQQPLGAESVPSLSEPTSGPSSQESSPYTAHVSNSVSCVTAMIHSVLYYCNFMGIVIKLYLCKSPTSVTFWALAPA